MPRCHLVVGLGCHLTESSGERLHIQRGWVLIQQPIPENLTGFDADVQAFTRTKGGLSPEACLETLSGRSVRACHALQNFSTRMALWACQHPSNGASAAW